MPVRAIKQPDPAGDRGANRRTARTRRPRRCEPPHSWVFPRDEAAPRYRAGAARKPRLLLCDEPTSALDPSGRREVLEILKSISKDTTVLFSTHILSDVERICDQIGILDGGRLVLEGALEEVRGSYRTDRLLVVPQETASLAALAQGLGVLPEVQKAEVADGGVILTIGNPETAGREILRYLSACDIPIAKYEFLEPNLEQVFLEAIHP